MYVTPLRLQNDTGMRILCAQVRKMAIFWISTRKARTWSSPTKQQFLFQISRKQHAVRSAKRSPLGAARLWVIPVDEVTLGGNAITSRGGNSQVDKTGLHLHGQILIMTANVLGIKIFLYKSKHTGHSSTGRRICFRNYKPIQGNITRIPFFSSQRNLSDEKKFWTN